MNTVMFFNMECISLCVSFFQMAKEAFKYKKIPKDEQDPIYCCDIINLYEFTKKNT